MVRYIYPWILRYVLLQGEEMCRLFEPLANRMARELKDLRPDRRALSLVTGQLMRSMDDYLGRGVCCEMWSIFWFAFGRRYREHVVAVFLRARCHNWKLYF